MPPLQLWINTHKSLKASEMASLKQWEGRAGWQAEEGDWEGGWQLLAWHDISLSFPKFAERVACIQIIYGICYKYIYILHIYVCILPKSCNKLRSIKQQKWPNNINNNSSNNEIHLQCAPPPFGHDKRVLRRHQGEPSEWIYEYIQT